MIDTHHRSPIRGARWEDSSYSGAVLGSPPPPARSTRSSAISSRVKSLRTGDEEARLQVTVVAANCRMSSWRVPHR